MSAFGGKADIDAQDFGTSTSTYLPVGWPLVIQIAAGDQLSAVGNDTTAGTLNVTECPT
jgi:hypothetical protein